jgi:Fur family transcriptional regulator, ferric uptake regulator
MIKHDEPGAAPLAQFATIEDVLVGLRERGGRVTFARRLLLDALFSDHNHRSADELAEQVQAQAPDVALSTIYRNLDELVRLGVVDRSHLGGPSAYHLASATHGHLLCEQCGSITEVPSELFREVAETIATRYEFAVTPRSHNLCTQVIVKGWHPAWRARRSATPRHASKAGLSRLSHRLTRRYRIRADDLDIQWTLTCAYGFRRTDRTGGIDHGSEGWGFESLRARPGERPIAILQRPSLLPNLLPKGPSSCPKQLIDRVGRLLAKRWQHVCVGVHRHADTGVPEHFHDRP